MGKIVFFIMVFLPATSTLEGQIISTQQNESSIIETGNLSLDTIYAGKSAPDFMLEDTSGNTVRLDHFYGNLIVLDLWFTNCAPCIANIPYYNKVQHFNDSVKIKFISICYDNNPRKEEWKKLIVNKNMKGYHLFLSRSDTNEVNLLYRKISSFPTYILIDKKGKVLGLLPDPDEFIASNYVIYRGLSGIDTRTSVTEMLENKKEFDNWIQTNGAKIISFLPKKR